MKKSVKRSNNVNYGTDDQMELYGYIAHRLAKIVVWILIILSLGVLRLVFYWKPHWMLRCTHKRCDLSEGTKILLKDKYDQYFVEDVVVLKNLKIDSKSNNSDDGYDSDSVGITQLNKISVTLVVSETYIEKESKYTKYKYYSVLVRSLMKIFVILLTNVGNTFGIMMTNRLGGLCIVYFFYKKLSLLSSTVFLKYQNRGLEESLTIHDLHKMKGLSKEDQDNKRHLYGENSIAVHLTRIYVLLLREILSPFYIFQLFSSILWFTDDYYFYAGCILALSFFSIIYTLYSIRRNERALRKITHKSSLVTVIRYNKAKKEQTEETIQSENLVPGDIIVIKNMSLMQCDAVILNGNVIVNESMLTGESVPITKTHLVYNRITPDVGKKDRDKLGKIDFKEHNKHILFCGTQVIQTRYYENEKVKAVVLRTGFNTTKGGLIRSILHPKPVDFRFNNDTYKYIGALACIATVGMILAIVMKVLKDNSVSVIIRRSLDLVVTVVPPALPGLLAAGIIYAQNKLRLKKIYCISPRTINICGSINTFVFDKTGTLTEDGLDMKSVIPTNFYDEATCSFDKEFQNIEDINSDHNYLIEGMASCHSLTRISGELSGDPLDLKIFEFTKWNLIEPTDKEATNFQYLIPTIVQPKNLEESASQVGILRQFPFSSSLQRMSVIVRALKRETFDLYCKGSPEKIVELSKPETIPVDFQNMLSSYTKEGYRVIAIARKQLNLSYTQIQRIERDKIEYDLEFLGLIVLENRLKPQTTPVIESLKAANIRTIMCTGDNLLTALSVARECEMIDESEKVIVVEIEQNQQPKFTYSNIVKQKVNEIEFDPKSDSYEEKDHNSHFHFALTGKSFSILYSQHIDLLKKIVVRGTVYARMSPEQKQQLIEILQELGYIVGMCGDGANDCGALKAANAGISLSDAEASVASPFTSKITNIECVPLVISEGRGALVTSFGLVRLICLYSITQFISLIILYSINSGLTDFEFLYVDLLITIIAFFFGRTEALRSLHKKPPDNKLVAWRPVGSLIFHTLLVLAFQLFAFFYVKLQPWFEAYEDSEDNVFGCYENTSVFYVSLFQFITFCIIFSKGAPYRKSLFSNYFFMGSLILGIVASMVIVLVPFEKIDEIFAIRSIEDFKFRLVLFSLSVVHFLVAFLFESFIIQKEFSFDKNETESSQNEKMKCYTKYSSKQTPYQVIELEFKNKLWAPVVVDDEDSIV